METNEIIAIVIAALGLLVAVWQILKNLKLQKKNLELQQEMLELQKKMLEQPLEKEAKEELKEAVVNFKDKGKKKTDAQIYKEHLTQKFRFLDFTGLNAILQKPLLLDQVYVKLRAKKSYRRVDYLTIADFKELDEEKTKEVDEDFVTVFENLHREYTRKREPLKLVILGQPGSGKTTLMKWIALQCAYSAETTTERVFGGFLPVFISLKVFGGDPDNTFKTKNIHELTIDLLNRANLSASFFDEQFEANKILFLLDGLDEVADENVRKDVIQWIENQNIRKNALLVTSRFSGLQEAKGLAFHDAVPVFTVQDFDIGDIERFLENWYKNIEVAVAGNAGREGTEQAIKKGKEQYEDLINIIKSKNYINLRQLAVNPLLLTIIAIVHRTRAVLPKERHKLYDECLKVMIELWNVANRKIDVTFSVENSMDNLSKIAVSLMKDNRREMALAEIKDILPPEIEDHPLDFFLKEMVLKAGLLYQSEGKYGFLHLTFQEYLVACYFARGVNQNDILVYRDKDYWTETFKLFVNTGNARQFFDEIIDSLEEKENDYWRQMQLWDDCLVDIVVEETRKEIELKFAEKVLNILSKIEYRKENDEFIIQLYAHYAIYKHAGQFVDQGWNLFHNARHPFVRSVGSSIVFRAGDEDTRAQLMERIKNIIEDFEKQGNKAPGQLMDFLFLNNNGFVLLIGGRKNLSDFIFALAKLKSLDFFTVYLDLRDLRYLRDRRDLRYLRDFVDIQDRRDLLDLLALLDLLDLRVLRVLRALRALRALRSLRDLRDLRDFRDFRDLRYLRDKYIEKYESIIKKHKQKIDHWAEQATAKLHSLSDVELLTYLPGTSKEELKTFRESHKKPHARKRKNVTG